MEEENKARIIKVKELVIHANEVRIINKHEGHESNHDDGRGRHPLNRRGSRRDPWDFFWGFREDDSEKETESESN